MHSANVLIADPFADHMEDADLFRQVKAARKVCKVITLLPPSLNTQRRSRQLGDWLVVAHDGKDSLLKKIRT